MYNKGNCNSSSSATATSSTAAAASATSSTTASNNSPATTGSNDRIEWSRATILGFIEDYRRQRVLWDPNTKGYHIKQTKYEALKALGQKYGAEIRSIRSKIKSLRSSFHREHGKVINGRRKGLNYQPMWFAYDAIRFILDGETGDSDEAEGAPKNDTLDSTSESTHNNANNNNSLSLLGWSGHATDEELAEERKISSRDIEQFNNHFLALGLQARHPMAMLAAVEAAAAASALSAVAQEKRQKEQDYALLKQQQRKQKPDNDDGGDDDNGNKHDDSSTPPKLNKIELSNNNSANLNSTLSPSPTATIVAAAALNTISKPFASPKPSSPLVVAPTTTSSSTPPPTLQVPPPSSQSQLTPPQNPPSSSTAATTTCSPENYNVLHGSRSLDENSAAAIGNIVGATAISSLPITAVFESDSNELTMLESTRTSTPVPLNYHKNATDLTMHRNGGNSNGNTISSSNGIVNLNASNIIGSAGGGAGSSRKRKTQIHLNANLLTLDTGDAPSPSKLQQHSNNALHSRQCDYLNNLNGGAGYSANIYNGNSSNNHPTSSSSAGGGSNASLGINSGGGGSKPSSTPIDEYGVFGEYVAITIRKLKTSKAKIVVKHLINNLLYEAEMGKYDQGIPSCKEPPELYKM
ncbi:rho GTPase-activating protein gacZ isoform X2 [Stomoxys calcitrans]|uniref:rho GTPase-activating protein gacZ isoform X2 n=1 Tax=Stomoxys calcitrans TaxID=35570 RepID=UPI0027E39925|nr:rho GTPase-activating protein gacZ isoform X2 [Stomoxys calcitrans]